MITLSLNFDGLAGKTDSSNHEQKVREIVGTHFTFPGSDKLKMGVSIKENGASLVTFTGPKDIVTEAKRIWHENVKPAADKIKTVTKKAAAKSYEKAKPIAKQIKAVTKKTAKSVKKPKAAPAAKLKKPHVAVKVSVPKKTAAKKKKA